MIGKMNLWCLGGALYFYPATVYAMTWEWKSFCMSLRCCFLEDIQDHACVANRVAVLRQV
jgi:hypothetical protein